MKTEPEKYTDNRHGKPANPAKAPIIVYGDDAAQDLAKMIWSALHGQDVEIIPVSTPAALRAQAERACLVLVLIEAGKSKADHMETLEMLVPARDLLCADFIAVLSGKDAPRRIDMLAQGYDAVFDMEFVHSREFTTILQKRIRKACTRLDMKATGMEYETFKSALNVSPDSYILFDRHKKLVYASTHYHMAYPETADKLRPGTSLDDIYEMLAGEQGVSKDNPQYNNLKAFWQEMDGEMKFYLPDSDRIWRLRGRQLPGNQGSIVITTDITEQEQQQELLNKKSEALEAALEESQEANAIQKQFINMVSHEFRTPLTIIDGNIQILQKRGGTMDEKDFQKRCKTVRSAISRLVYIMEGVLSSNMMRTGRFQIVREGTDLKKMIRELCEEFTDLSSSLRVSCDIESLPDYVQVDKKVMTLVLTNLLSNAVKFSKNAPDISIEAHTEQDEKERDMVAIKVKDNGIGIPENELDKIFDRYYRASTASGVAGTGIGLNLVRDLLELHGGQINVRSREGEGTKFVVKLPLDEG